MNIVLHRDFVKAYSKLRPAEQHRFRERRDLFVLDPFHPLLRNHGLRGLYAGYRSFSVTGDLRVIFKMLSEDRYLFVTIGTHSALYR